MRIPSSCFVLFQFTSEPGAGRIMTQPGRKHAARAHFAVRINRLALILTNRGGDVTRTESATVPRAKVPMVFYRRTGGGPIETWTGLTEEDISGLCRQFRDWILGDTSAKRSR
jgi:hypothetical protein